MYLVDYRDTVLSKFIQNESNLRVKKHLLNLNTLVRKYNMLIMQFSLTMPYFYVR